MPLTTHSRLFPFPCSNRTPPSPLPPGWLLPNCFWVSISDTGKAQQSPHSASQLLPGPSDLLLAACPGTGPAEPSCAPGCRHSFSHLAGHPLLSSQIPHPGHFIHNPSRVLGKQTGSQCSLLGTSSWRPGMSTRTVELCSPVSTSTPRTAPALCSPPPRHWAHSDPRTPPLYSPRPGCPLLPPHLPWLLLLRIQYSGEC